MATPIIDHNLLTLDYWQDSVTYEGKTVPGGTIGCEALNIPDTLREKLAQASIPLQKIVAAIKENNLTAELLRPAKGSVLHMIQLAKDTPPFSRADAAYYNGRVEHIFSEEGVQNTLAYVQAAAVVGLLATFNEQFRQGVGITKIITLAEELPATIRNYKSGMTAFADELHKGKRTPDGYAQVFAFCSLSGIDVGAEPQKRGGKRAGRGGKAARQSFGNTRRDRCQKLRDRRVRERARHCKSRRGSACVRA